MKYQFLLFFMQVSLFFLSSEEIAFDWSWRGNENELYFQVDLFEGLQFDPYYTIYSTENEQGCELTCLASKECSFKTQEGYQLKSIKILVLVENTENPREILYRLKFCHSYWKLDDKGKRTVHNVDHEHKDYLLNSTIDVTEDPLFYSFIEKEDSGVVRFSNLFRC